MHRILFIWSHCLYTHTHTLQHIRLMLNLLLISPIVQNPKATFISTPFGFDIRLHRCIIASLLHRVQNNELNNAWIIWLLSAATILFLWRHILCAQSVEFVDANSSCVSTESVSSMSNNSYQSIAMASHQYQFAHTKVLLPVQSCTNWNLDGRLTTHSHSPFLARAKCQAKRTFSFERNKLIIFGFI